MALAMRLDKKNGKVYCIIGDGELAEGQIWEAAMAASNFKIDNVVAIVDQNLLQATGTIKERFDTNPIPAKWTSFGWHVIQIDGHNIEQIIKALDEADTVKGQPTVIIARTVKGKGFSFAENVVGFHNGSLTPEQYASALKECDQIIAQCN
jgi:transketolase